MNSSPIPQETKPTRLTRKSIAELVEAGKVEEAVDALRAGMKATRKFYSPITKSLVEEPDHRTRIDAARIVLAYAVGLPVQRTQEVEDEFVSLRDLLAGRKGDLGLEGP